MNIRMKSCIIKDRAGSANSPRLMFKLVETKLHLTDAKQNVLYLRLVLVKQKQTPIRAKLLMIILRCYMHGHQPCLTHTCSILCDQMITTGPQRYYNYSAIKPMLANNLGTCKNRNCPPKFTFDITFMKYIKPYISLDLIYCVTFWLLC